MSKDTGGPAFPSHGTMGEVVCEGMTLRDYFAAKALQGLLACETIVASEKSFADKAYQLADEMLKAREE